MLFLLPTLNRLFLQYISLNNILPVGSAACAQALGNIWLPEMKNQHIKKVIPKLPKLVISGSATQITAAQIKKLANDDEFDNFSNFIAIILLVLVERCANGPFCDVE